MIDTINKIDIGISKRFNPKLAPIRNVPELNLGSVETSSAMKSIQNVDDHLS